MEALKAIPVQIRHATAADAVEWERLRTDLWPDGAEDHAAEIASFFAGILQEPNAVIFAEAANGEVLGYAELSLRTDIPGYEGQLTGYVEGLYVVPKARFRGISRQLMQESRRWARQQQCTVFASDRADRIVIDRTYTRHQANPGK